VKRVTPDDTWLESWRYSYPYDLEEVYGQVSCHGYAYAYENRRDRTLALVEEVVPRGSRILDVAAAQGNFSLTLAERGYRVTWNDLRADLVDYVKLKHEHGDITFAPGNVFELEFNRVFDCVVATEVIEHVAHPDDFLKKLSQMVRPGGYVVLTTPNGAYFRNHLPRFSECADPSVFESVQFKPNADGHIFLLWPDEVERLAEQFDAGAARRVHDPADQWSRQARHRLATAAPTGRLRGGEARLTSATVVEAQADGAHRRALPAGIGGFRHQPRRRPACPVSCPLTAGFFG